MRAAILFLLLIFAASAFAGYCWQTSCQGLLANTANWFADNNPVEIFLPPPLRGPVDRHPTQLNINDILAATNRHRAATGLPPLSSNTTLNEVANIKADDIFTQQFFEHVSPDGIGPADLITSAGYDYILSGENLALGNYRTADDLVQAWMDSPGHRENILKSGFTEIGLSAVINNFEGRETMVSVQTFATPATACDSPDQKLQTKFDQQYNAAESLHQEINELRPIIQDLKNTLRTLLEQIKTLTAAGNAKIKAGNAKTQEGNRVAEETGSNESAELFWDEGKRLQQEGHALHQQAAELSTTYHQKQAQLDSLIKNFNQKVKRLDQLNTELKTTTDRLNQQIRRYNTCLDDLK